VAKRTYSEVKHDDKFHATLTKWWEKLEPHLLHIGLAAGGVLLLALIWMLVASGSRAANDEPWAERAAIEREEDLTQADRLEKLAALVQKYSGEPVAALTQLEIAQGYNAQGNEKSMPPAYEAEKPEEKTAREAEAKQAYQKAAAAAEQFLADFPEHSLAAVAAFEAGKARLALGEPKAALPHFEKAAASKVLYLAALAQWHAARCHQALGDTESARSAYQRVIDNKQAGFLVAQAQYDLARLDEQPVRDTQ